MDKFHCSLNPMDDIFLYNMKKLLRNFKTRYTFKISSKSIENQIIYSEYNGKNNIKSMTFAEKCA